MLKKIFISILACQLGVSPACYSASQILVSAWGLENPPMESVETFVKNGGLYWWDADSSYSGVNYMKYARGIYPAGYVGMSVGFENSYVPYNGPWLLRLRWCPATSAQICTVSQSSGYVDSSPLQLSSATPIVEQQPTYTLAGSTPDNVAFCYTFVGEDGDEWSTSAQRTCQDAHVLPEEPAICYINYGGNLNVVLGTLERSKIPTTYNAGTPVTKTVPVMCSSDAAINVEMKVSYEAITVSGSEVIKTPSNGLGVAMLYNGTPIGPGTPAISLTYQPGVSNLDLGFVAVRDPNVNLGDIPTGDFAASASLIMNQQ